LESGECEFLGWIPVFVGLDVLNVRFAVFFVLSDLIEAGALGSSASF
jgi:hypothetical protein